MAILGAGSLAWIVSFVKRDVSIVDSLWAPMFVIAGLVYAMTQPETGPRSRLVLWLAVLWAIRLSGCISRRSWGESEDVRYREIRANNEPHFAFKSLYIVFGLQGVLVWLVSLPLLAAVVSPGAINPVDYLGVAVWFVGMIFETGADVHSRVLKPTQKTQPRCWTQGCGAIRGIPIILVTPAFGADFFSSDWPRVAGGQYFHPQ